MNAETQKYLDAFAKLLAPPPHIYVFADLIGLWYDATEDPRSHQVIVGLSREMFHRIEMDYQQRTGQRLPKSITITHLPPRHLSYPSHPPLPDGVDAITIAPKLIDQA